ncbi:hypothetical protein CPC08DRAFT_391938 [Agrocybe pediades]|nr:hypothetical protein CPC08DRAFT_391938 [Agrocybe pediades]
MAWDFYVAFSRSAWMLDRGDKNCCMLLGLDEKTTVHFFFVLTVYGTFFSVETTALLIVSFLGIFFVIWCYNPPTVPLCLSKRHAILALNDPIFIFVTVTVSLCWTVSRGQS